MPQHSVYSLQDYIITAAAHCSLFSGGIQQGLCMQHLLPFMPCTY